MFNQVGRRMIALALMAGAASRAISVPSFSDPGPFRGVIPLGVPRVRFGKRGSKDRLICDRSSSVRKLQRWLNNGEIDADEMLAIRAASRHAANRRFR